MALTETSYRVSQFTYIGSIVQQVVFLTVMQCKWHCYTEKHIMYSYFIIFLACKKIYIILDLVIAVIYLPLQKKN